MEATIEDLKAEVAALHLFVIALINALPGVSDGPVKEDFDSNYGALRILLSKQGLTDAAQRLDDAIDNINHRSISHLAR